MYIVLTLQQEASYSSGAIHQTTPSSTLPRASTSHMASSSSMSPPTATTSSSPSEGSSQHESQMEGASPPATLPGPRKPPRKKRPAPPPPPPPPSAGSSNKPLQVSVAQSQHNHSRTSSHSSGFDESNVSPLESPGNSSRESTKTAKTKTSIDATSIESSEVAAPHEQSVAPVMAIRVSTIAEVPPTTGATGGTQSHGTLSRKKRKAPAPPPPPPPTGET